MVTSPVWAQSAIDQSANVIKYTAAETAIGWDAHNFLSHYNTPTTNRPRVLGITADGKVGIGIDSEPWDAAKWVIRSRLNVGKGMGGFAVDALNGGTCIGFNAAKDGSNFYFGSNGTNNGGALIWSDPQGSLNFSTRRSGTDYNGANGVAQPGRWMPLAWAATDSRLRINADGTIQIGKAQAALLTNTTTANPLADYRLAVDGKLVARSMHVTLENWADFVFEPDYSLLPLPELEQYLRVQKHLPAIPSAAEVAANGLDLGQMQARLLQTVEELTLHVIALGKQNEQLRAQVAELATQVRPTAPAVPATR